MIFRNWVKGSMSPLQDFLSLLRMTPEQIMGLSEGKTAKSGPNGNSGRDGCKHCMGKGCERCHSHLAEFYRRFREKNSDSKRLERARRAMQRRGHGSLIHGLTRGTLD